MPDSNWTLVATDSDGDCAHYIDLSTIAAATKYKKAWLMDSCKTPRSGKPGHPRHLSTVMLDFFDCAEQSYQIVQVTVFVEKFGRGAPTASETVPLDPKDFHEAAPGSTAGARLAKVCTGR